MLNVRESIESDEALNMVKEEEVEEEDHDFD